MAKPIKIRIAAYTNAAARDNNEDALLVHDDLTVSPVGHFETDKIIDLGPKGALLVVADGMGGMNAGEVASGITCATLQELFEPENITKEVLSSEENIKKFIRNAIVKADERIKKEGNADPEKEGMGSTVVLGWIIKDIIYVGWCGDSRLYCFNKKTGLVQLSHDHSYVQELVDSGQIDEETAFYHPNSNIITRSLGDLRSKARPDVESFQLHNGDIILLCSDGLSGALQNREIADIMNDTCSTMENCMKALWIGAEKAGWTDNVTTVLCEIVSGAKNVKPLQNTGNDMLKISEHLPGKSHNKSLYYIIASAVVFLGVFFGLLFGLGGSDNELSNAGKIDCSEETVSDNIQPNIPEEKIDKNGNNDDINVFVTGSNQEESLISESKSEIKNTKFQEISEKVVGKGDSNKPSEDIKLQDELKEIGIDADDEDDIANDANEINKEEILKGKNNMEKLEYVIEDDNISENELKDKLKSILKDCKKDGNSLGDNEKGNIIKKLDGKKVSVRISSASEIEGKNKKFKKGDIVIIELKFRNK